METNGSNGSLPGESTLVARGLKKTYGNFQAVHRCAVLAAESRAGQYRHADIEQAAAHLHGMLEALRAAR